MKREKLLEIFTYSYGIGIYSAGPLFILLLLFCGLFGVNTGGNILSYFYFCWQKWTFLILFCLFIFSLLLACGGMMITGFIQMKIDTEKSNGMEI
jgi:hypothetical protein